MAILILNSDVSSYSEISKKIAGEIRGDLPDEEMFYSLDSKKSPSDSSLIRDLKERTGLHFRGALDKEYKLDAVTELHTTEQRSKAVDLRKKLKGYGQFFKTHSGKELFVLEGVNLPEGDPSISQRIQSMLINK